MMSKRSQSIDSNQNTEISGAQTEENNSESSTEPSISTIDKTELNAEIEPNEVTLTTSTEGKKNGRGNHSIDLEVDESDEEQPRQEIFKRKGFYQSIMEKPLDELINHYKEERDSKIKSAHIEQSEEAKVIEEQLGRLRQNLANTKKQLEEYNQSRPILIAETLKLEEDIQKLSEKLYQLYREFNDKKQEFLNKKTTDRIKNLGEEIDLVIVNAKKLSGNYENSNTDKLNKIKASRLDFFEAIKKEISKSENILEDTATKVHSLNEAFINPTVTRILWVIAIGSTGTAGWFFSIFAEKKGIDSTDQSSFLLELIFNFGISLFPSSNNIGFNLLILLGAFLVIGAFFFIIYLLLSFIEKRLNPTLSLNNKIKDSSQHDENVQREKSRNHEQIDDEIQDPRLVTIGNWVMLLPIAFVVTSIFLLIVFFASYSPLALENIKNLTIAISSQVIGSSIALVFGAMLYIYFNFILESRIKEKDILKARDYWELWSTLLLFVLCIICISILSFFPNNNEFLVHFSLTMFLASITSGGVVIGYALKFSSLLNTQNREQTKVDGWRLYLANYENTSSFQDLVVDYKLVKNLSLINEQILEALVADNKVTQFISQNQMPDMKGNTKENDESNGLIQFFHTLTKHVKSVLKNKSNEKETDSNFINEANISDIKKDRLEKKSERDTSPERSKPEENKDFQDDIGEKFIADIYHEIRDKLRVVQEKSISLKSLNEEIELMRINKAPEQIELQKDIRHLEESCSEVNRKGLKTEEIKKQHIEQIISTFENISLDLHEGYELGNWYKKDENKF